MESSSTCGAGDGELPQFLKVEMFDSDGLQVVSSSVDDGPTAALTQNVPLVFTELQLGFVQKQSERQQRRIINLSTR